MATKYTGRLRDKRVLVLGGTSGIGFSVAEASVEYGAIVVISSSTKEKIDSAQKRIAESYPNAQSRITGKACDLANPELAEDNLLGLLKFATNDGNDKLDHIVMTSGDRWNVPKFEQTQISDMHRTQQVRLIGSMLVGKHAKTFMNSSTWSSLTLTSGVGIWKPRIDMVVQTTMAASLQGLTRSLALQLAPIRTNLVAPGAIETPLWGTPEVVAAIKPQITQKMVVDDLGSTEDVAEAYLYCMKDKFVTGSTITSDGSYLLM